MQLCKVVAMVIAYVLVKQYCGESYAAWGNHEAAKHNTYMSNMLRHKSNRSVTAHKLVTVLMMDTVFLYSITYSVKFNLGKLDAE